jgi:hypothetical protein
MRHGHKTQRGIPLCALLLLLGSGARNPVATTAQHTFVIEFKLAGAPRGVSDQRMANELVQALTKNHAGELTFLAFDRDGPNTCRGDANCDHVTVTLAQRENDQTAGVEMVLLIAPVRTPTLRHPSREIPVTETDGPLACEYPPKQRVSWGMCVDSETARVDRELRIHVQDDHPTRE